MKTYEIRYDDDEGYQQVGHFATREVADRVRLELDRIRAWRARVAWDVFGNEIEQVDNDDIPPDDWEPTDEDHARIFLDGAQELIVAAEDYWWDPPTLDEIRQLSRHFNIDGFWEP